MAKFYGSVGYANTSETAPGVWTETMTEKNYYGDFVKVYAQPNENEKVNDDIDMKHTISIVADPYAYQNYIKMKYVTISGEKWKIIKIEVFRPRIQITLGGIYNV